jgi:hypothetical protein
MDATPGLNRRLIATTSILVALLLIGVLLAGAVLSLLAAIEGANAPTSASTSSETPKSAPPKPEAREAAAPILHARAEEPSGEFSIVDGGVPFAAAPEPFWQRQPGKFLFSSDASPEHGAPSSSFPETACCFTDEQTTSPPLADSAPMMDESGAPLSDQSQLAATPTQMPPIETEEVPFTAAPEAPWQSQSPQLRFPPDSPPTAGPPKFAFPGPTCVLAGQPTTSPQAADAAAMMQPSGAHLTGQRMYVPPPDHVAYAEGEVAFPTVDGAPPRQHGPPGSVFPETRCSFGDEPAASPGPADTTVSESPSESPDVAFPVSPNDSAGQPTTPGWTADATAGQPPLQSQPQPQVAPQELPLREGASGIGESKSGPAGEKDEKQTLGEAPKETKTELQFLRRQSILLDPGEYQIDVTFQYLIDESDFALAQVSGAVLQIGEARRRQRLFLVPIELRVGISPVTQAFVNVPVGWSNSEFAFAGRERSSETTGLGDISAGFTKLLIEGNESCPDILGTFAFSAPTGEADFVASLSTPGSSLGSGFWSLTAALTCIQVYDPIVLFYGGGYRHRYENTFDGGIKVEPGEEIFLRVGGGFAVNPRVTLSASLTRSYLGADKVNGVQVAGGIREPTIIRLAATIAQAKKAKGQENVRTVEPFVNFGITEDAIDSLIGISWTR